MEAGCGLMAKYTDLQLLNMTSHVINAKNNCDPRYHIFLSKLVLESGVPPDACEQRIVDMARAASLNTQFGHGMNQNAYARGL